MGTRQGDEVDTLRREHEVRCIPALPIELRDAVIRTEGEWLPVELHRTAPE